MSRLSEPLRLGLWGMFDIDCFGPALTARICRGELARRLPGAAIRVFAPYGHLRPVRSDGGDPAEPLGRWSEGRLAELAEALDCVIVAGEVVLDDGRLAELYGVEPEEAREIGAGRFLVEGLGDDPGRRGSTLWHAVSVPGSAPDDAPPGLLRAVAGQGSAADPLLVLPRMMPAPLLRKRLAYLRLMRWYPEEGPAIVVQGGRDLLAVVEDVATALRGIIDDHRLPAVVLAELAPPMGDHELADALAVLLADLPVPVYRLPPVASHEDVVAAIAGGDGFVGTSRYGATTAVAYGRPGLLLEPGTEAGHDAGVRVVGALSELGRAFAEATSAGPGMPTHADIEADVDTGFDQLAITAADVAAGRRADRGRGRTETTAAATAAPSASSAVAPARVAERAERAAALQRAHEVRGERMAAERVVFADRVADLEARLAAEEDLAAQRIQLLEGWGADQARQLSEAEAELSALQMTRTFRWTSSARNAYGRARSIVRKR